jgi:HK97 family phage major capsid protein
MPGVNRQTENVLLPPEVSSEIWAKVIESSAVMQLSTRRVLPGAGQEVQMITGDPVANWVGEGERISASSPAFDKKSLKGYKMGVIVPFTNEFKRDKSLLYDEIVARVPDVIANKFDATVFGNATKPGELFDTLDAVTGVDVVTDVWPGLVAADATISDADGILNGWVISPKLKSALLTAVDGDRRPIFISSPTADGSVPNLLGSPTYLKKGVYKAGTPEQLGIAGDWTSAQYGVVEDVKFSISDQATLKIDGEDVNLWENDMFAVKFTFEAGWRAKYLDQFVKLIGAQEE